MERPHMGTHGLYGLWHKNRISKYHVVLVSSEDSLASSHPGYVTVKLHSVVSAHVDWSKRIPNEGIVSIIFSLSNGQNNLWDAKIMLNHY